MGKVIKLLRMNWKVKHWWFSGRIVACHAIDPVSIPGHNIYCILGLFPMQFTKLFNHVSLPFWLLKSIIEKNRFRLLILKRNTWATVGYKHFQNLRGFLPRLPKRYYRFFLNYKVVSSKKYGKGNYVAENELEC